jgi:hypothetical protein
MVPAKTQSTLSSKKRKIYFFFAFLVSWREKFLEVWFCQTFHERKHLKGMRNGKGPRASCGFAIGALQFLRVALIPTLA